MNLRALATPEPDPTSRCSLCGGAEQLFLPRVEDCETRQSFSILRCLQCQAEQTVPAPADLAEYYSAQYHGGRHGFTARHCARRRVRWIASSRNSDSMKLLDIGCGEGTFLQEAQRFGWQGTGTEMNPATARAQGLEVFSSLDEVADFAPFDCITLWHTLEHMRDPHSVLRQAHRMLAPEGTLFVAVPNARGWQARIFGVHWLHRDVPRHLFHFGPASLRNLLESEAFEVLKSWHQEFEYDLMGWSQSALNAVSSTPNVFFSLITGRKPKLGPLAKLSHLAAGTLLSALALPLVPLGALFGMGGTLVMRAQKSSPEEQATSTG